MPQQRSRISSEPPWLPVRMQLGRVIFVSVIVGCGSSDGLNRQPVSGTVTFDGQPISTGAILFEPATQDSGTAVGAIIRKGNFAISMSEGPVPGRYRVRIYASSGVQAPPAKGQTDRFPRPMVDSLPARYNAQTELIADVSARGANRYGFSLNSSRSANVR